MHLPVHACHFKSVRSQVFIPSPHVPRTPRRLPAVRRRDAVHAGAEQHHADELGAEFSLRAHAAAHARRLHRLRADGVPARHRVRGRLPDLSRALRRAAIRRHGVSLVSRLGDRHLRQGRGGEEKEPAAHLPRRGGVPVDQRQGLDHRARGDHHLRRARELSAERGAALGRVRALGHGVERDLGRLRLGAAAVFERPAARAGVQHRDGAVAGRLALPGVRRGVAVNLPSPLWGGSPSELASEAGWGSERFVHDRFHPHPARVARHPPHKGEGKKFAGAAMTRKARSVAVVFFPSPRRGGSPSELASEAGLGVVKVRARSLPPPPGSRCSPPSPQGGG